MATLNPFRGLRYDPHLVGDVARVVAPPYDVIDSARQAALYASSPHNVVRLILNRDGDPYAAAAATLAGWRSSGVLALDAAPALYLYAQRFPGPEGEPRERIGIIGALRLESFASGKVRPHERTLDRAKNDRFALLSACRASLSPIFGLVSAPHWPLAALVPDRPPDLDIAANEGTRDRVWRLDDPTVLASIRDGLDRRDVFIADGHHRYETALRYQQEARDALGASAPAPGAAPYDYVLAYLTRMEDPGLVVLPTHRVLQTLVSQPSELERALATHFRIERIPWTSAGAATMRERLEAPGAKGVRLGVAARGADALWELSASIDALPFPPEVPAVLRALDVTALHQIVLRAVLGLPIGERGGTPGLTYTQDAAAALAAVERDGAGAAFFLPATSVDALRAVSVAGLTMPEKSTYFSPKLLTGLVIYPFD